MIDIISVPEPKNKIRYISDEVHAFAVDKKVLEEQVILNLPERCHHIGQELKMAVPLKVWELKKIYADAKIRKVYVVAQKYSPKV